MILQNQVRNNSGSYNDGKNQDEGSLSEPDIFWIPVGYRNHNETAKCHDVARKYSETVDKIPERPVLQGPAFIGGIEILFQPDVQSGIAKKKCQ
jgi:hypothetical protein